MHKRYDFINNVTGWVIFAIAAVTYLSTIEPTTSFWDCGEYIATAYKLQVGHPPGAPMFQILGAFFALFSFDDATNVAMMINAMSALSSAFTILFLFWTITAFGRRIAENDEDGLTDGTLYAIIGSGVVGALAYTFSDSFWFSAVEGEVYAMSSFFTAIIVWMIFKWDRDYGNPHANRWIILISLMMGMAVGVHMLALLAFPAVGMVYYFKKYKVTPRGFVIANIVTVVILGIIFKVIFPLVLNFSSWMEITFVNGMGLPFFSGTIFAFVVIIAAIVFGLRYTKKRGWDLGHMAVLSFIYLLIGYSTFLSLVIRSNANTPIDENNPETAPSLLAYLNRQQYGDWPISYGWYYNSPLDRREPFKDGTPIYEKDEEKGEYVVVNDMKNAIPNYDSDYMSIFPRMWDRNDPSHAATYKEWGGVTTGDDKKPSFGANLRFFFRYQLNYMYFRYFMWNFSGRQNDEQGRGGITEGQWLSGIKFIDEPRLGPQNNVPLKQSGNKGRNVYFMLPFLLGLVGLIWHWNKNKQDAWIVTLLFVMTGFAIVVYVNQYAYQPRERDYAYVGSFYAFAIWIGLGTMAIFDQLRRKAPPKVAALAVTGICVLAVPGLMAKENWDDHDRSGRYTARDFAKNYLDSCLPNAILFTNGDNDTFPLWYVQEVERYRTDVRVVNLSLLNTDWYIDQMKRAAYDSEAVPFSMTRDKYVANKREIVYYVDKGVTSRWGVDDFIRWIASDDPQTKVSSGRQQFDFFPTRKIRVPVEKENVLANGIVEASRADEIVEYIDIDMGKRNSLLRRDVMILDLMATNDWKRPVYFAITVGNRNSDFMYLTEYFELTGMAYQLVPIRQERDRTGQIGSVNADRMYDVVMNKFQWGNMEDSNVYLDETNRRMTLNFRNNFARLASELNQRGKRDSAAAVLDLAMEKMPHEVVPYNYFNLPMAEEYFLAGAKEQGTGILTTYADVLVEELEYYADFPRAKQELIATEIQRDSQFFQQVVQLARRYTDRDVADDLNNRLTQTLSLYGVQ